MSTVRVQAPVYVVRCDNDACLNEYQPVREFNRQDDRWARREAAEQGWQVRPNGGKGSRTAPDLCPSCAKPTGQGV